MVDKLDINELGVVFNPESIQILFILLQIAFGPVAGVNWDNYDGKFYQPYNKSEKIGRMCDFVTAAAGLA